MHVNDLHCKLSATFLFPFKCDVDFIFLKWTASCSFLSQNTPRPSLHCWHAADKHRLMCRSKKAKQLYFTSSICKTNQRFDEKWLVVTWLHRDCLKAFGDLWKQAWAALQHELCCLKQKPLRWAVTGCSAYLNPVTCGCSPERNASSCVSFCLLFLFVP